MARGREPLSPAFTCAPTLRGLGVRVNCLKQCKDHQVISLFDNLSLDSLNTQLNLRVAQSGVIVQADVCGA